MSTQRDITDLSATAHVTEVKPDVLQLKCHVGLGDAFVLQGLVHSLLLTGKYGKVHVNVREAYLPDVRKLYHHIASSIDFQVHETYDEPPADLECMDKTLRTGYFGDPRDPFFVNKWDREFYRQAGIPFINRWLHCYVPFPIVEMKRRDFKIRHHDPKRKYLIEGLKPDIDIVDGERDTLLDWVPDLMAAAEIHCIDSCVLNLVESMYATNMIRPDAKLYYHRYARSEPPPTMLAPWREIT